MSDCAIPATITWVLGLALAVGTFLSYIPQEVKIFTTKSSAGISPLYLFLALVFCYGSLTTSLLSNWGSFACCANLNFWECNELLMDVWQIVVMPLSTSIIEVLFLVYFKILPVEGMSEESDEFQAIFRKQRSVAYRYAYWFCVLLFGNCWVCAMLLWPQIYRTWRQKTAGSISLLTQAIQCPGNLLVVIFQASAGNSWYVWMPFLNAGVQQLILCLLIIWYDYMPCNKGMREARLAALKALDVQESKAGLLEEEEEYGDEKSALVGNKETSDF